MKFIFHCIDNIESYGMPVDTLVAIEAPGGDDQRGIFDTATARQVFANRRDQELWHLG
jgi:hypothetical protein